MTLTGNDVNSSRHNEEFWANLKSVVDESDIVIDRPKGTCHEKTKKSMKRKYT